MPRTGAQRRGIQRERDLRELLEGNGYGHPPSLRDPPGLKERWFVARAAGSLGDADLVAARWNRVPMLIEVKSTKTAYSDFPPEDRAALIAAGELAGFDVWLCWWPVRRHPVWLPPSAWPKLPAHADTTHR